MDTDPRHHTNREMRGIYENDLQKQTRLTKPKFILPFLSLVASAGLSFSAAFAVK